MKLIGVCFLIEVALFVGAGYLFAKVKFHGFILLFIVGVGMAILVGRLIENEAKTKRT